MAVTFSSKKLFRVVIFMYVEKNMNDANKGEKLSYQK